jgi:hypothetical protein
MTKRRLEYSDLKPGMLIDVVLGDDFKYERRRLVVARATASTIWFVTKDGGEERLRGSVRYAIKVTPTVLNREMLHDLYVFLRDFDRVGSITGDELVRSVPPEEMAEVVAFVKAKLGKYVTKDGEKKP